MKYETILWLRNYPVLRTLVLLRLYVWSSFCYDMTHQHFKGCPRWYAHLHPGRIKDLYRCLKADQCLQKYDAKDDAIRLLT